MDRAERLFEKLAKYGISRAIDASKKVFKKAGKKVDDFMGRGSYNPPRC